MAQDPIAIIEQIITSARETAAESTEAADAAAKRIIREWIGLYLPPPENQHGFEVEAVEPDIPKVSDNLIEYEAQLEKILAMLASQLHGFFNKYYPLSSDAFDEATAWIVNQITNGGTGINPAIEAQMWQRARERIITDGRRVEQQIATGYAAKGYMMPPGAMLQKIDEARMAQLRATGESSTTIAVQRFEAEIAQVRFAIEQAIASRSMAMSAAADYIRAVATAPDSAVRTMNMKDENRARMMSAAATWYGARLDRDKIVLQSKLAEHQMDFNIYEHRRQYSLQSDDTKVRALGTAADIYGKTAQAALSSLNSIVSTASNI